MSDHLALTPKIFYFGTPVVLISTHNEDGSANLAPMSSAWWLGDSALLGLSTRSQTVLNLRREGRAVLNLPDVGLVDAVDRLALTTGRADVPDYKRALGYRFEPDKFGVAGLTPLPATPGWPPRVAECPVHLEVDLLSDRPLGAPHLTALEVRVVRSFFAPALLNPERRHHVDPDRWRPLIMNFCEFYGLGEPVHGSRLAAAF